MIVYRLAKSEYSRDLSGKGAEKAGGRWNSKGVALVYTGDSRALCTTEIAVHMPLGILPKDYELITIKIPDSIKFLKINLNDLPVGWKSIPHSGMTQELGDQFIKAGKYAVLKVPSAVVHGDFNYLINPNHKDFNMVKITKTEKFDFDDRLFLK
jgi:RES domain-containing protein